MRRISNRRYLSLPLAGLMLGMTALIGCTVGPNYKRPSVDVPGAYRGVAPDASDKSYDQSEAPKPQRRKLNRLRNRWVTRNGSRFSRIHSCRV
jgi:hypothetical protein